VGIENVIATVGKSVAVISIASTGVLTAFSLNAALALVKLF